MDSHLMALSVLIVVILAAEAARPWRYDIPQEKKTYDTQWSLRTNEERQRKYYENPKGAKIVRQSHFAYEYRLGHKLTFLCVASGDPLPRITWLKDGLELNSHKNLVVHEWKLAARKDRGREDEESKQRLKSKLEIDPTTQGDQGQYTCQAENDKNVDTKTFKAEFANN